jgi:holdfast attachment protein HfaA
MAVAVVEASNSGTCVMPHSRKALALVLLGLLSAGAAQAQSWSQASSYNGYGAYSQNTPSNYQLRDANGNLTLVNGQFQSSSNYSSQGGTQYAQSGGGGVGTSGAGAQYGQASAIGNSLNVVVLGSHNTTVVDANQINTGNQTATVQLNH